MKRLKPKNQLNFTKERKGGQRSTKLFFFKRETFTKEKREVI